VTDEIFTDQDGKILVHTDQRLCVRCVLPENFPSANLDTDQVCDYCRNEPRRVDHSRAEVDTALRACLERTAGDAAGYDCVLLYSGGKDSSLSLVQLVKEHGLRVLALTLDNGFLAKVTAANMSAMLDNVGADHIVLRPRKQVMHGIYRSALTSTFTAETVKYSTAACGSCIGMVFAAGMRTAASYGIPLLAGGWTPGQLTNSAFVPASFLREVVGRNLEPVRATTPTLNSDLDTWTRDSGELPVGLLNPLYATNYTEAGALRVLEKYGWRAPKDTDSCSTNCRLNGLLIIDHIRKFGYHPYVYEMAHHVRIGAMSRDDALLKLSNVNLRASTIGAVAVELGIPSPLRA
jgi:tRNA(Ile)-lysidine synthase TilS/MesJ